MKIFLAGATGAVGQALVPLLTSHGHTVIGTTRSPAEGRARCARSAPSRSWSTGSTATACAPRSPRAAPDAIVHQMTALGGDLDLRQLRARVRRHQPPAHRGHRPPARGRARGRRRARRRPELRRLALRAHRRAGQDRGRPAGPRPAGAGAHDARGDQRLEAAVTGAGGIALRYGGFYGPGTGFAPGGEQWEMVSARKFPLVGDGGGVWSFVHIEDVADGDARRARARHAGRDLQRLRRRAGAGPRVAAGGRRGDRRAAAAPRPALGRPAAGRARRGDDVRDPRRVERARAARARLGARVADLARGHPGAGA